MRTYLLTLLLLLAFISRTDAQSASTSPATETDTLRTMLDSVEIVGSWNRQPLNAIPFSIYTIDLQETVRPEAASLAEVLLTAPGVHVADRFNISQGERVSVRGVGSRAQFGVRGIKVILDGIPLTFPDGQTQLNNLNLNTLSRVELIRGPSSFPYGNSAGGVLYMESAPAAGGFASAEVTTGSFGRFETIVSGGAGSDDSRFSLSFGHRRQDGFRDHSQVSDYTMQAQGHTIFSERWELIAVLNLYYAPYLLNPSSLAKEDAEASPEKARGYIISQGAGKELGQYQAGLSAKYRGDEESLDAAVYGVRRDLLNAIPGRVIELDRLFTGARLIYTRSLSLPGSPHISAGFEAEGQFDKRIEFINEGVPAGTPADKVMENPGYGDKLLDQEEDVFTWGAFAQLDIAPVPEITLSGGLRYDAHRFTLGSDEPLTAGQADEVTFSQLSPMLGVTWQAGQSVTLFGNYSTAFQAPTTTELTNQPDMEGGFNPALHPETIHGFEAGARGYLRDASLYYGVTLYTMSFTDLLIPYQTEGPSEEIFYRNTGSASNKGIELELMWQPVQLLRIDAQYTVMDFTFEDYLKEFEIDGAAEVRQLSGKEVPGVPQQFASLRAAYSPLQHISAGFELSYTGGYYANDYNGVPPGGSGDNADHFNDGFFLAALFASYTISAGPAGITLFAGIDNLFDTRYNSSVVPNAFGERYFEPGAGRRWYAGIRGSL